MDNTPTNLSHGLGAHKRLQGEATAFRIWRAAQSVDWDCTMAEIARELGMTPSAVHSTARRKGWISRFNPDAVSLARAPAGRKGVAARSLNTTGAELDLCDMMGLVQ